MFLFFFGGLFLGFWEAWGGLGFLVFLFNYLVLGGGFWVSLVCER